MGQIHSDQLPDRTEGATFDPLYGFENGRKERVMKCTQEEMESMKMPLAARTYCAHHYIIYNTCRLEKFPLVYRCGKERHAFLNCKYEDFVIRMKEYEREKRLRDRALRLEKKRRKEELLG